MAVYDEETRKALQSRKRRAEMKRAQQVKLRNTVFLGAGVLVLLILFIVLVASSCSAKKDKKIEVVTTQQPTTVAVETTTEEVTTSPAVMYTTDVLNLRKEPNTDCEIIKQIAKGKKVEIIEDNGEWCKVKQGKDTGYVSKEYLSTTKDGNSDKKEEPTATEEEAGNEED
jgi:hypothetical protein